MIGILCNKKRERITVSRLHNLFRPLIKGYDMPLVVFTLQELNLQQKMITGWIISCKTPSFKKTKLPDIIFNLSIQPSRSDIKKIRSLMEIEGVWLINITNRYNQLSIMEILSSDSSLKKYVLPYIELDDKNRQDDFLDNENFIVKPLKGTNLSNIIYGKQTNSDFMLCDENMKSNHKKLDFDNDIFLNIKPKKVLLLKTPELLTSNNQLCITRIYAQRSFNGDWEILTKVSVPQNENVCDLTDNMVNNDSIQIISYINRFIPDMFFCFVDFVTDMNRIPYLLNFGGWDNKILNKSQNRNIQGSICKNMLLYAHGFLNRQSKGEENVD